MKWQYIFFLKFDRVFMSKCFLVSSCFEKIYQDPWIFRMKFGFDLPNGFGNKKKFENKGYNSNYMYMYI